MDDEKEKDEPQVQAEDNSIAVGGIHIGGDLSGSITIGHGYTAEQVSVLLKQITTTLQPKPFDGRCPYKGLDVFEEEDAELFFGRERLVEDLISRVKESRTVFITGPSGSGKSSLVRAGLIHTLKEGAIKNLPSERWLYETMKPGREPPKDLALAFSRLKSPQLSNYFLAHVNEANVLNECAESVLSGRKDQRFVLFVDQFEEVFTQVNQEEERQAFLNMLAHAATVEDGRVIVLFAMRSDFLSNCAIFPKLNNLINQSKLFQIGAMQPEELVSAIALPARHVGLPIEDELIARIINDMKGEPGALPLMQFALKDLFDSQQQRGGVIALTLKDYLQHGGIHKSLERHADSTFAKLSADEQDLARSIFSGLIEIGRGTQDTKRTALFDELVPANTKAAAVEAIVQKLADARLIITDEQAGKDTVTISHEKLIEAWPWLKKLVNENRDIIALQNEITSDAKEWEDHQQNNSYLYRGARLATAQEKIKDLVLSANARAYLAACRKAEKDSRLQRERAGRRIIIGLISFSTIILGLLIFSLLQLNILRAQKLGSQAQAAFAEQKYHTALLYAHQSNQIYKNDASDMVLSQIGSRSFANGRLLYGHTARVNSMAWSLDGQLASASGDATLHIWDLKTGQPTQILKGHAAPVTSVAWSPDGQLASGSSDNTVIIWDLNIGQPFQTLEGHTARVNSVAWSADGQLASGSSDSTVIIWDLNTGRPAKPLSGHTARVNSVAWSADGQLASGSEDATMIIWDLNTGLPAQTLRGHFSTVTSMAWSADGQLASGSSDDTVIVWDLNTGQPFQTLEGHTARVNSVAWSADGQLASGSSDNTVIIWDVNTGRPAQTLRGHTAEVNSVIWSPDGQLASGSEDATMIIWDLKTDQPFQLLEGHIAPVTSVAWSADGQLASGSLDDTVIVWDLKTGRPTQILRGYTAQVNSVAWSADGQLASGSEDATTIIWDLKTGRPAQTLKGHTAPVTSVAWSADGQLASGSSDSTVIIWDLNTGQPTQILKAPTSPFRIETRAPSVTSVAWSADGQLASGSSDNTVIVWDLKTGQPFQTFRGHAAPVTSVAWSPDGQLASGSSDNTVIIRDLNTGQPFQTLRGHTARVNSVAWSADGQLASASEDATMIIWDLSTGQPFQTLRGHTSEVISVAWSADGQLASGSRDNMISTAIVYLLTEPCNKIFRNMTAQEWVDYQGVLYIYEPACPNLPVPFDLRYYPRLTWKGRIILLGDALGILAIVGGFLWLLFKPISEYSISRYGLSRHAGSYTVPHFQTALGGEWIHKAGSFHMDW